MAKRRDMLLQLSQRRADKVPIKMANVVQGMSVQFVPQKDVIHKTKDGPKVVRVVSALRFSCKVAGLVDVIEHEANVEIEEKDKQYGVRAEFDRAIMPAFKECLDVVVAAIRKAQEDAQADTKAVEAPAMEVANA
jgi:hypothetical protein